MSEQKRAKGELAVHMVELPPLHVASAWAFGEEPEHMAFEKMITWARPKGLLQPGQYKLFGFNNPSPSAGSPRYGYEVWLTVGPEVEAEGEIKIKDFGGGLYAVTRCAPGGDFEAIPQTWHRLVAWVEKSPYRPARHQWLEEHVSYIDLPPEEMVLDLYAPVAGTVL